MSRLNVRAQDESRNVKMAYRDECGAVHARVVVSYHEKHGILPIRRGFGRFKKLPQSPVSVPDRILCGGRITIYRDTPGGILPWRVIAHRKCQGECRMFRRAS